MNCPKCGRTLDPDETQCRKCAQDRTGGGGLSRLRNVVIGLIVVALAAVGVFVVKLTHHSGPTPQSTASTTSPVVVTHLTPVNKLPARPRITEHEAKAIVVPSSSKDLTSRFGVPDETDVNHYGMGYSRYVYSLTDGGRAEYAIAEMGDTVVAAMITDASGNLIRNVHLDINNPKAQ